MSKQLPLHCVAVCALAGVAFAQQPHSLLFSTNQNEQSRSGTSATSLGTLADRSVAVVTPNGQCDQSAEKFAPSLGWQTLIGDEDGDGDVYTPGLMGGIDAILVTPWVWDPAAQQMVPRTGPIDWFDVNISPQTDVGINVSGAPGLRQGDCGRVEPGGSVEHFITAEQLIVALGMVDAGGAMLTAADIDLDAIAVDTDRDIYCSFEADHTLTLATPGGIMAFPLADGGVAMIPGQFWMPDADGDVAAVAARRGIIVWSEPDVDAMVVAAGVNDNAAACLAAIGNLDGLALDTRGGNFTTRWAGGLMVTHPHLLFSGSTLTGGGVLSTVGGGSIAVLNGCPLGRTCASGQPTNGLRVGLEPTGTVDSLDGLETLAQEPCRFVLGSPTPVGLGGVIEVDVATNLPVAVAFLLLGLGAPPVSPSIDFTALLPTSCFPELYPAVLSFGAIPIMLAADGFGGAFGSFTSPTPFIAQGVLFQAVALPGFTVELSSPLTVH